MEEVSAGRIDACADRGDGCWQRIPGHDAGLPPHRWAGRQAGQPVPRECRRSAADPPGSRGRVRRGLRTAAGLDGRHVDHHAEDGGRGRPCRPSCLPGRMRQSWRSWERECRLAPTPKPWFEYGRFSGFAWQGGTVNTRSRCPRRCRSHWNPGAGRRHLCRGLRRCGSDLRGNPLPGSCRVSGLPETRRARHLGRVQHGRAEVDSATVIDAMVVVESRDAVLAPPPAGSNDLRTPMQQGLIRPGHIEAKIGELLLGTKAGRSSPARSRCTSPSESRPRTSPQRTWSSTPLASRTSGLEVDLSA